MWAASCVLARPTAIFTARSRLAESLYIGCHTNTEARLSMPKPGSVPLIIVAGVQKGGSSSMRDLLSGQGLCHTATGELQFFNHECFAGRTIREDEREAYFAEWHHCRAHAHALDATGGVRGVGFDKSPATYVQPWIPLRVCQALPPQQKILLMLRDLVSRAFSGYHQCLSVGQFRPPKLLATASLNRSHPEHDSFSVAVALEVEVAHRCSPWGSGYPERDAELGEAYAKCCVRIAAQHGFQSPNAWPLCQTTPRCNNDTRVGRHHRKEIAGRIHGTFGKWCYTHVLAGVYSRHLQLWYRYHLPRNVLIGRSEAFFANESAFMQELMHELVGLDFVVRPVAAIRSAAATRGARMPNATRLMLQRFCAPGSNQRMACACTCATAVCCVDSQRVEHHHGPHISTQIAQAMHTNPQKSSRRVPITARGMVYKSTYLHVMTDCF